MTTEAPIETLEQSNFEEELDYYRRNYFLNPGGSNAEFFVESINKMLGNLLGMYTGRKIDVEVRVDDGGKLREIRVKDRLETEDIIDKILAISKPEEMPYNGRSVDDAVEELSNLLESEICFNAEFLGQMHPHDNIPSFMGGIAGKILNGNTIAKEVSRVTTYLEKQVVSWLANEFGYNPDSSWMSTITPEEKSVVSSGNITTGGTTANLAALLVARNKAFNAVEGREGGVAESGLKEKQQGVVIGSEYAHYSIEKLCGYIGIGSDNFKKVRTLNKKIIADDDREDSIKQMMWDYARQGKKVVAVVATAGLTETGNLDDLEGIGELIDRFEEEFGYRPHYHVDAAHGGGFVLHDRYSPRKGGLLKGIERADSITVDPHKMLYTHYSAGAILFRDQRDHALLKQSADYLFKIGESHNLGQYRVEGSMGLEGALQAWASLFTIGKRGYQVIQENALRMTKYLAQKVEADEDFEILHEPEMNILCFRYHNKNLTPEMNDEVNKNAQAIMYGRGIAYISNDMLLHRDSENDEGRKIQVFRAVLMHPYSSEREVDIAFDEVKNGVEEALRPLQK